MSDVDAGVLNLAQRAVRPDTINDGHRGVILRDLEDRSGLLAGSSHHDGAPVNRIASQRAVWCVRPVAVSFGVVNWSAFVVLCLISVCVAAIIAAKSGWIG